MVGAYVPGEIREMASSILLGRDEMGLFNYAAEAISRIGDIEPVNGRERLLHREDRTDRSHIFNFSQGAGVLTIDVLNQTRQNRGRNGGEHCVGLNLLFRRLNSSYVSIAGDKLFNGSITANLYTLFPKHLYEPVYKDLKAPFEIPELLLGAVPRTSSLAETSSHPSNGNLVCGVSEFNVHHRLPNRLRRLLACPPAEPLQS